MTRIEARYLQAVTTGMAVRDTKTSRTTQDAHRLGDLLRLARAEYASTPRGEADLRSRLATATKDDTLLTGEDELTRALRTGANIRERNDLIRRAAQPRTFPSPTPTTQAVNGSVPCTHMRAGDRVRMRDLNVLIVRDAENCKDMFGQPMIRYWSKREDTSQEGYVIFGTTTTMELDRV